MPNVIEMDDAKYREWGNSTYDVLYLKNWKNYFKEIFDNRDAIKSLVKKSFYGRYKSTHLGVIWQFITPLMILLMYVIFFEGGIRTENKDNMWLFLASAVFPFNFLRMNTIGGSVCFTGNANYIKKMYFPHSIFIYSHIINTFIVFVITLLGLFIAMAILGLSISIEIMPWLVVYILISIFFSIGSALLLSTINVLIREHRFDQLRHIREGEDRRYRGCGSTGMVRTSQGFEGQDSLQPPFGHGREQYRLLRKTV